MNRITCIFTGCCFVTFSISAISDDALTNRVQANLGNGCHIAATLPKGVRSRMGGDPEVHDGGLRVNPLPASWKSNMGEMYFSLMCIDSTDPDVSGAGLPIKYDPASGHWVKDMSDWIAKAKQSANKFDQDAELERINATDAFEIDGVNTKGWGMTQKDTIGDESDRQKYLSFCLLNGEKAICGYGIVSYLSTPKDDLTKRALEIFRTIEFLPDVPAASPVKP